MTRRASERFILRVEHPLITVPRKRMRVALVIMPIVFGAFCFAYLALRSVFPVERLSLFFLSASLLGIALSVVSLTANDRVGLVRIAKSRPLRFTPSPAYEYWFFASATLWGLSSMLALFHWVSTGILVFGTSQGRGNTLFAPLLIASGPLFVGWRVARIFRQRGISLSPEGLVWQTVFDTKRVHWDDLEPMRVYPKRGGNAVSIHAIGRSPALVSFDCAGMDPVIVSEAIEYFRVHPDERHKTLDPLLAVTAFAES